MEGPGPGSLGWGWGPGSRPQLRRDPRQGHHVLHHQHSRVPVCHQAATTPLGQHSVTQPEHTGCHRSWDEALSLSPGVVAQGWPHGSLLVLGTSSGTGSHIPGQSGVL